MSLRETLLTEWARLKQETAAIETLLSSRGWMPGAETDAHTAGIAYIAEAREFVNNWDAVLDGDEFTSNDFVEHLVEKHGKDNVNEASARGVFRTLEAEGRILTKTPSRGRVGAIYSIMETSSASKAEPARKDSTA